MKKSFEKSSLILMENLFNWILRKLRMTKLEIFNCSDDIFKKVGFKKNLFYLIGFSGAGKSSIAKKLAARLNYKCFDTDTAIEIKENMSIPYIFNIFGEDYFRKTENSILKEVSNESNGIIACGGGITENPENIEIMKQSGYIIWIYADFEDCLKRINKDNKPMFRSYDSYLNLYFNREDAYFKSSDLIINNNKDLSNIINKIYAEINNII
jgi:shikimate kinase